MLSSRQGRPNSQKHQMNIRLAHQVTLRYCNSPNISQACATAISSAITARARLTESVEMVTAKLAATAMANPAQAVRTAQLRSCRAFFLAVVMDGCAIAGVKLFSIDIFFAIMLIN